jgi:hypothetical protein
MRDHLSLPIPGPSNRKMMRERPEIQLPQGFAQKFFFGERHCTVLIQGYA